MIREPNDVVTFYKTGPTVQEMKILKKVKAEGECVVKCSKAQTYQSLTKKGFLRCLGLSHSGEHSYWTYRLGRRGKKVLA